MMVRRLFLKIGKSVSTKNNLQSTRALFNKTNKNYWSPHPKEKSFIIVLVKVPAENRWHAQVGEFEKSLIMELLTKVWAGSRETTKENAKAWASAIPRPEEVRRGERFPEPEHRGLSGKGPHSG